MGFDDLTGVAMGKMTPVTCPAADGTMISGNLTLPPGSNAFLRRPLGMAAN